VFAFDASCAVGMAQARSLPGTDSQPCEVVNGVTKELVLADGRRVYVGARSLTNGDRKILALGEEMAIIAGSTESSALAGGHPAVGTLIDEQMHATLVGPPPTVTRMLAPRAIYKTGQGWEVSWFEAADPWNEIPTGRVMFARFDGKSWSPPDSVGLFDGLLPNPDLRSQMVRWPRGIGFAVPVRLSTGSTTASLMIRDGDRWLRREVPAANGALYLTLLYQAGWWILGYTGQSVNGEIGSFVTRSSDDGRTWISPVMVASGRAYWPTLIPRADTLTLFWIGEAERFHPRGLRMALGSARTGSWGQAIPVPGADSATTYAAAVMSSDRVALVQYSGGNPRGWYAFAVLGRDTLRWTEHLSAAGILPPILTRGSESQVLAIWGTVDPMPDGSRLRSVLAERRIECHR
jgi:hypothetical protein